MPALPASISVFGPGLMGGSLLMALRQRAPDVRLGAWARRAGVVEELRSRKLIDFGSDEPARVAGESDLAILCVPVEHMAQLADAIKDSLPREAAITDVGSVKKPVVDDLENILAGSGRFVGSHPMCGSEEAGLDAARADLYQNAVCVITPTPRSRPDSLATIQNLWESVGARVILMDPTEHDRAVSLVSHVPHLVAALLVELVGGGKSGCQALCAGGFRDTTRIASGSPDLWAGILSSNRGEVVPALLDLERLVAGARGLLEKNDIPGLRMLLRSAAVRRSEILAAS
jgi:prephenate dehydrogenase